MPSFEEILTGLREIANDWRLLAIVWHGYLAVLVLALLSGVRPLRPVAGITLVLPLFSVSALAWAFSNPFNGTIFFLVGAILLIISVRLPRVRIRLAPVSSVLTGAVMFAFGWVYPHFLESASYIQYLFSAPAGLIPCPTLSIVIGLSMMLGCFGARVWSVVLSVTGVFYGIFGAALLGVSLDWILLIGALAILFTVDKGTNLHPPEARDRKSVS